MSLPVWNGAGTGTILSDHEGPDATSLPAHAESGPLTARYGTMTLSDPSRVGLAFAATRSVLRWPAGNVTRRTPSRPVPLTSTVPPRITRRCVPQPAAQLTESIRGITGTAEYRAARWGSPAEGVAIPADAATATTTPIDAIPHALKIVRALPCLRATGLAEGFAPRQVAAGIRQSRAAIATGVRSAGVGFLLAGAVPADAQEYLSQALRNEIGSIGWPPEYHPGELHIS